MGSRHAEGTDVGAAVPRAPGGAGRRSVGPLGAARPAHPRSVPVGLGTVAALAPGLRPLASALARRRGLFYRRGLQISPCDSAG